MANAKSFSVSPPNSSMASTGISEVSVVLTVRTSTWLMEWFAIVMNVHLMSSDCMLSLMRWNTTTVSYSEYPRMVSSAAMVFGFTSRPTSAYTPMTSTRSCSSATMAVTPILYSKRMAM